MVMELKLEVMIDDSKILISSQYAIVKILKSVKNIKDNELYILMKDRRFVKYVDNMKDLEDNNQYDKVIAIVMPYGISEDEMKDTLENNQAESDVENEILAILDAFGYVMEKKEKRKPAKAQHRWSKEVSEIEFYVDTRESKATVIWQKRNEMLLKAGATMMKEAPLNKDGSVGLSAKMGNTLREEHKDAFKNFVTTKDIILKSVNEIGLFLYFAGTNGWLELVDKDGKTIDEWTVVK